MNLEKIKLSIENMDELTKAVIEGPINHTVYDIWKYLQKNDARSMRYAESLYQQDGDKINSYYRPFLERILGCRSHLRHDCQHFFCKKMYEYES